MKITIKVTKEVLRQSAHCPILGISLNCELDKLKTNCAVAVAVRDLFPKAKVFNNAICLSSHFPDYEVSLVEDEQGVRPKTTIRLPQKAIDFITEFDRLHPLERPGMDELKFDIEVPDEFFERTIGISEAHEILKRSETLELAN